MGPVTAARPVPGRWTGGVTDHTVVGDRVAVDVGFDAAWTRLRILAEGGMLLRASEVAYGEGINALPGQQASLQALGRSWVSAAVVTLRG